MYIKIFIIWIVIQAVVVLLNEGILLWNFIFSNIYEDPNLFQNQRVRVKNFPPLRYSLIRTWHCCLVLVVLLLSFLSMQMNNFIK